MRHPMTSVLVASLAAVMTTAADSTEFDARFAEAVDLCVQIYLPNSMARSEESNLAAERKRLENARDAKALGFASPAGVEFLVAKSKTAKDSIAQACGVDLLAALARRSHE